MDSGIINSRSDQVSFLKIALQLVHWLCTCKRAPTNCKIVIVDHGGRVNLRIIRIATSHLINFVEFVKFVSARLHYFLQVILQVVATELFVGPRLCQIKVS